MDPILTPFLAATVRTATPLAFAALGEQVGERAGVIFLGLEGAIIAGCLGAAIASGAGPLAGFAGGILAGVLVSALFAAFVIGLRADQIITGTAITMFGLGLTGAVHRGLFADAGASTGGTAATVGPVAIPGLSQLPILGPALFAQPWPTYLLYGLVPALAWWMRGTHAGLALRATGAHRDAAAAAGIRTRRVRTLAVLFAGAMGGLCGATLVLAQVGTFTEGMSAGRGFIAIAIVVLGRWAVWGTAAAALVFGGAFALQYLFQATGWDAPYQLFLGFPYLLTLTLLALQRTRTGAPAELGRP